MPRGVIDYNNHGGYVDIVDDNNVPTGEVLPLKVANKRKLFHRGAHVVLITPDNKVYVQKRSAKQFFMPSRLDISLGGACDPGETPEQAAVREAYEETGLKIFQKDLEFITIYRESVYRPSRRTYSRTFSYIFAVRLRDSDQAVNLQAHEVTSMTAIPMSRLRKLIRRGYDPKLGRLITTRRRYRQILDHLERMI